MDSLNLWERGWLKWLGKSKSDEKGAQWGGNRHISVCELTDAQEKKECASAVWQSCGLVGSPYKLHDPKMSDHGCLHCPHEHPEHTFGYQHNMTFTLGPDEIYYWKSKGQYSTSVYRIVTDRNLAPNTTFSVKMVAPPARVTYPTLVSGTVTQDTKQLPPSNTPVGVDAWHHPTATVLIEKRPAEDASWKLVDAHGIEVEEEYVDRTKACKLFTSNANLDIELLQLGLAVCETWCGTRNTAKLLMKTYWQFLPAAVQRSIKERHPKFAKHMNKFEESLTTDSDGESSDYE